MMHSVLVLSFFNLLIPKNMHPRFFFFLLIFVLCSRSWFGCCWYVAFLLSLYCEEMFETFRTMVTCVS